MTPTPTPTPESREARPAPFPSEGATMGSEREVWVVRCDPDCYTDIVCRWRWLARAFCWFEDRVCPATRFAGIRHRILRGTLRPTPSAVPHDQP